MKIRTIIIILLLLCVSLSASCAQSGNQPQADDSNATKENKENIEPVEMTITDGNVFLNPDSKEFARAFGDFFGGINEPDNYGLVQYWDTGTEKIKFETVADETLDRYVLKINGQTADIDFLWFDQIIVTADIAIITNGGTDIRSTHLYIFDLTGNTLLKIYYLNNKGMVISSGSVVSIVGNKIILSGTRFTHGINLVMKNDFDVFPEYSDYIYQDIIYNYENIKYDYKDTEVYIHDSNAETVEKLNKDEIVEANFELEYLGGGKFGKIRMTENIRTLGEYLEEFGEQIGYTGK